MQMQKKRKKILQRAHISAIYFFCSVFFFFWLTISKRKEKKRTELTHFVCFLLSVLFYLFIFFSSAVNVKLIKYKEMKTLRPQRFNNIFFISLNTPFFSSAA